MEKDKKLPESTLSNNDREKAILEFWRENKIFEKTSLKGEGDFVFYDGPPFATGLPHYGHLLAGTIKDVIPRYQSMMGKRVRRRWGWDCHGLPLENEIEKELGLKSRKDIEEYGVEKFNTEAFSRVMRYAGDWKEQVPRMGRFVDMDDDYKTMDGNYTESVWWAFKNLYDKGLIYKGYKSMHLCPRCGTTLSNFEVNQGYKDITDISVTVEFPVVGEENTYFLAWTTTPWTLPGNVALAVGPEIDYVSIEKKDEGSDKIVRIILAKDALQKVFGEEGYKIVGEFKGTDLVGKEYEPPFDTYKKDVELVGRENAWKVYGADFVTTTDGVGIVHIAPGFGEDDLKLAQKVGLPVIQHVGVDGLISEKVEGFGGKYAKPKEDHQSTDIEVIKYLAHKGILFSKEKIIHSYPHCWRCDTPLLNYASSSWFVKVSAIKEKVLEANRKIKWVPESIGAFRFGNWIEGSPDWAISRSRFWGAPLPVWESVDKKETYVAGSIDDVRARVEKSGNKYFVMRHGQAKSNVEKFVDGGDNPSPENHLTEKGLEQVAAGAEILKSKNIDFVVASPLVRTRETAEAVSRALGLSVESIIFDERLREVHGGKSNGAPLTSLDAYENSFDSYKERFTKKVAGENYLDVKKRVGEAMYELEEKYKGKNILIVSHEVPLMLSFAVALGWDVDTTVKNREEKIDFINNAEVRELPFVPLPHNDFYELDYHKPFIDRVALLDNNGEKMVRVPEVFDCWFESGSMPFAQDHYPFDKTHFDPEKGIGFPADFIAEGVDQTRGWFYSLIILGVALFDKSPYNHVVVNGTVLAEDGQKMSKRLKNYPDPMLVVEKFGADAVRLYLIGSPAVRGGELSFSEKGVAEVANKMIGRLLNVYAFYEPFCVAEDCSYEASVKTAYASDNVLDKWIIARLKETGVATTKSLDGYTLDAGVTALDAFVDDLSTWYLRRSRDRFRGDDQKSRAESLATTRFVLVEYCKLLAPYAPFVSDYLYLKLKDSSMAESVHLENWSKLEVSEDEKELIGKMKEVRDVISSALKIRAAKAIKVRQPLSTLSVKAQTSNSIAGNPIFIELIKDEVNVKNVICDENLSEDVSLDINITPELEAEGFVRDIVRMIQDARKEADLMPADCIDVSINVESDKRSIVESAVESIKRTVNATNIKILNSDSQLSVSINKCN